MALPALLEPEAPKDLLKEILPDRTQEKVLVAQSYHHSGLLHANASNGGGIIDLSGGYSLEFIKSGDNFVTLQLYRHAIGVKPRFQTWNRNGAAAQPKKISKISLPESQHEDLI